MSRFHTLLVPVDFSDHSAAALDLAIELARAAQGTIHLLHAYEVPLGAIPPYGIALPGALLEQVRDAAARRLEKSAQGVVAAGVRCEPHVLHAAPAEAIADAAASVGADLVVMGTRGLTGVKHVLLGSVAERTVRIAPCPVLTIRAKSDSE
jgi:nucleotide-binding universal stress UspA family protein